MGPYYASIIYFVGVNVYIIGLLAEFVPISEEVATWTKLISFELGSVMFTLGGIAECIENTVFTSCKCDTGWIGALLNASGGFLFLLGSTLAFASSLSFEANFIFGIGS